MQTITRWNAGFQIPNGSWVLQIWTLEFFNDDALPPHHTTTLEFHGTDHERLLVG